jgi:hypothetical protein
LGVFPNGERIQIGALMGAAINHAFDLEITSVEKG